MSKNAILWIRDGVLVNRMHINPVAFAASVWVFVAPERRPGIESLINFGFEKSGVSCAEKMRQYNVEREHILADVDQAADFYNQLATEAALGASFFDGAEALLKDLCQCGVSNYITSAVEQHVLDAWAISQQGTRIAPYLKEILGKRVNFTKGRDHFEHVFKSGYESLWLVADAPSEIRVATDFSREFNITSVGFGNVITVAEVMSAVEMVSAVLIPLAQEKAPMPVRKLRVDPGRLSLPNRQDVQKSLQDAGAKFTVAGDANQLMNGLREILPVH